MDGITVLKTYDAVVANTWGWSWPGFIVALIVLGLVAVIILIIVKTKEYDLIFPTLGILMIGSIIPVIIFGNATPIYESRYDVYIHGTINMDEFNEKYRIIDQDGLVYTITENTTE